MAVLQSIVLHVLSSIAFGITPAHCGEFGSVRDRAAGREGRVERTLSSESRVERAVETERVRRAVDEVVVIN